MVRTTTHDSFILPVKLVIYHIHQTINLKGLHKISKNIAFVLLSKTQFIYFNASKNSNSYLTWNITKQGLKLACDGGGCLQLGFDKIDGL